MKGIEKGEAKIQRQQDIMNAVARKLNQYKNPWQDLKVTFQYRPADLHHELYELRASSLPSLWTAYLWLLHPSISRRNSILSSFAAEFALF